MIKVFTQLKLLRVYFWCSMIMEKKTSSGFSQAAFTDHAK